MEGNKGGYVNLYLVLHSTHTVGFVNLIPNGKGGSHETFNSRNSGCNNGCCIKQRIRCAHRTNVEGSSAHVVLYGFGYSTVGMRIKCKLTSIIALAIMVMNLIIVI